MFALLAMAGDLGGSIGPGTVGMISQKTGDNIQAGLFFGGIFPVILIIFLEDYSYSNNLISALCNGG